MKRIIATIFVFMLLLLQFGCASPQEAPTNTVTAPQVESAPPSSVASEPSVTAPTEPADTEFISSSRPVAAVSMPAFTEDYSAENGRSIFYHTYQTMYLTLDNEETADRIIIHYLGILDKIQEEAADIQQLAVSDYDGSNDWSAYFCQLVLSPERIDPGVLSLHGTYITHSGGGHPYSNAVSLNYDLVSGDPLTLGSIMHKDASAKDFCDLVIEALTQYKDAYALYEDYADTVSQKFSAEESLFETFYFTNTGLNFYFDVYEIAPYAAGIIHVEIPYEKLAGIINDAYFPPELDAVNGSLLLAPFDGAIQENVSVTEAVLDPDGTMRILTTDTAVQNLRIKAHTEGHNQIQYTVYATYSLQNNEAVVIAASDEQFSTLQIMYENAQGSSTLE